MIEGKEKRNDSKLSGLRNRRLAVLGLCLLLVVVFVEWERSHFEPPKKTIQENDTFDFQTFSRLRNLHPATSNGNLVYPLTKTQQSQWENGSLVLPDKVEYGAGIEGHFDDDQLVDRVLPIALAEDKRKLYGEEYYVLVVSGDDKLIGVTWLRREQYSPTSSIDLEKLGEMAVWLQDTNPD